MNEVRYVWVTAKGEAAHLTSDCGGIVDGHAKARREGHGNYPPERWPVNLALTGFDAVAGRSRCRRCWPTHLPMAANDSAPDVAAAQAGPIARAARALAAGPLGDEQPFDYGDDSSPSIWRDRDDDRDEASEYINEVRAVYTELMTPDDIEDLSPGGYRD